MPFSIRVRPPNKMALRPSQMVTEGILVSEKEEGVVVNNPHTTYKKSGTPVLKEKGATFLFIPRGMITKIKSL